MDTVWTCVCAWVDVTSHAPSYDDVYSIVVARTMQSHSNIWFDQQTAAIHSRRKSNLYAPTWVCVSCPWCCRWQIAQTNWQNTIQSNGDGGLLSERPTTRHGTETTKNANKFQEEKKRKKKLFISRIYLIAWIFEWISFVRVSVSFSIHSFGDVFACVCACAWWCCGGSGGQHE